MYYNFILVVMSSAELHTFLTTAFKELKLCENVHMV